MSKWQPENRLNLGIEEGGGGEGRKVKERPFVSVFLINPPIY